MSVTVKRSYGLMIGAIGAIGANECSIGANGNEVSGVNDGLNRHWRQGDRHWRPLDPR